MTIHSISPVALQELINTQREIILLDVREAWEAQICQLSGSLRIPTSLIAIHYNELPEDIPIIIYCHHGIRSLNVARYLEYVGFDDLYNLEGGIDAWAQQIDPIMKRY